MLHLNIQQNLKMSLFIFISICLACSNTEKCYYTKVGILVPVLPHGLIWVRICYCDTVMVLQLPQESKINISNQLSPEM